MLTPSKLPNIVNIASALEELVRDSPPFPEKGGGLPREGLYKGSQKREKWKYKGRMRPGCGGARPR